MESNKKMEKKSPSICHVYYIVIIDVLVQRFLGGIYSVLDILISIVFKKLPLKNVTD